MRYPGRQLFARGETRQEQVQEHFLPYDRSRVVLIGIHGGFEGTGVHQRRFPLIPGILIPQRSICSQGPKENTVNDVLAHAWENDRVRDLVMVTKLVEPMGQD